jgi:hypothetical protein
MHHHQARSHPSLQKIVPLGKAVKHPSIFIMVLLPEPLCPIMAQKLPFLKETINPLSALTSSEPIG